MPKYTLKNPTEAGYENLLKYIYCEGSKQQSTPPGLLKTTTFVVQPEFLINAGYTQIRVEVVDQAVTSQSVSPLGFQNRVRENDLQSVGTGMAGTFDLTQLLPHPNPSNLRQGAAATIQRKRTNYKTREVEDTTRNSDFPESLDAVLRKGRFEKEPVDRFPGLRISEMETGRTFAISNDTIEVPIQELPEITDTIVSYSPYESRATIETLIRKPSHILEYYLYHPKTTRKIKIPVNPKFIGNKNRINVGLWRAMTEGQYPKRLNYSTTKDFVYFNQIFRNLPLLNYVTLYYREISNNHRRDKWYKIGRFALSTGPVSGRGELTKYFKYTFPYCPDKNYIFRLMPTIQDIDYSIYSECVIVNNPRVVPEPTLICTQNPIALSATQSTRDTRYNIQMNLYNIDPGLQELRFYKQKSENSHTTAQLIKEVPLTNVLTRYSLVDYGRFHAKLPTNYAMHYRYGDIWEAGVQQSLEIKADDPETPMVWLENKKFIEYSISPDGTVIISGRLKIENNYIDVGDSFEDPSEDLVKKIEMKQVAPYLRLSRYDTGTGDQQVVGVFELWKEQDQDGVIITPTDTEEGITFEITDSIELSELRNIRPAAPTNLYKLEYASLPLSYLVYRKNPTFKIEVQTNAQSLNYSIIPAKTEIALFKKFGISPTDSQLNDFSSRLEESFTPECVLLEIDVMSAMNTGISVAQELIQGGVQLKINIPPQYTSGFEIDHIKVLARPTNLKKAQYIAKLHPIGMQLVYYDFDVPMVLCDKVEYTFDFFDKRFNLMSQKRVIVDFRQSNLQRSNTSAIGAGASISTGY